MHSLGVHWETASEGGYRGLVPRDGQKSAIALCGWATMISQCGQINYTVMTFFVLRCLSDLWGEQWRLTAGSPDESAQYPRGEGTASSQDEGEKDG